MWQPTPIRALALLGLRFPADEDRVFLVVSPPVFSDRARSRSPWPVTRTALYLDAPNSLRNVATVSQRPTAHSLASSSGNRSVLTVTSRPLKTNDAGVRPLVKTSRLVPRYAPRTSSYSLTGRASGVRLQSPEGELGSATYAMRVV